MDDQTISESGLQQGAGLTALELEFRVLKISFKLSKLLKKSYFLSSFSRQSLAIRINFDISKLIDDCPNPKSSYALLPTYSAASPNIVTRICCFVSSFFHLSANSLFSSVMLTIIISHIVNIFEFVIYKICPISNLQTFISSLYKLQISKFYNLQVDRICLRDSFFKSLIFPLTYFRGIKWENEVKIWNMKRY